MQPQSIFIRKQRTKDEEISEFEALYQLLSSLSTKEQPPRTDAAPSNQVIVPVASAASAVPAPKGSVLEQLRAHVVIEEKKEAEEAHPMEEWKESIIVNHHAPAPAPPLPTNSKRMFLTTEEAWDKNKTMIMKIQAPPSLIKAYTKKHNAVSHEDVLCEACLRTFPSAYMHQRHLTESPICTELLTHPSKKHIPYPTIPVQDIVYDLQMQAIQGKKPLECKYCHCGFVSEASFRRHFQITMSCNRAALYDIRQAWIHLFDSTAI